MKHLIRLKSSSTKVTETEYPPNEVSRYNLHEQGWRIGVEPTFPGYQPGVLPLNYRHHVAGWGGRFLNSRDLPNPVSLYVAASLSGKVSDRQTGRVLAIIRRHLSEVLA